MAADLDEHVRSTLTNRYALAVAHLETVSTHSFNTVLRAETDRGRLSVRVGTGPRIHPDHTEAVEAAWLDALASSDVLTPTPVRSVDGATCCTPDGCRISVFSWIDGRTLDLELGGADDSTWLHQAGATLAELHQRTATLRDGTLDEMITGELDLTRAAYFGPDRLEHVAARHREQIEGTVAEVLRGLADLWRHPPHRPHLLHGDFGPRNLIVHDDRLAPIDFQDLRVGFDVLDVGITVADLTRRDPDLVAPFLDGYRSIRPLDAWTPEVARLATDARTLNIINLVLHLDRPGSAAAVDELVEHL